MTILPQLWLVGRALAFLALGTAIVACHGPGQPGPMQRAGTAIDNTAADAGRGAGNAAQAVGRALGHAGQAIGDSMDRAGQATHDRLSGE